MFLGGTQSGKTVGGLADDLIQAVDEEVLPKHLKSYKQFTPPFSCRVFAPSLQVIETVTFEKVRDLVPKGQLLGGSWSSAYDKQLRILHFQNGSQIAFFSYDQDVQKLGAASIDRVHYDEEPPKRHRVESRFRVMAKGGDEVFTMTPTEGLCVDYETECLTKRGWRRGDELGSGDVILTYNSQSKMTEWKRLEGVYEDRGYDKPMWLIGGRKRVDALFTDKHRWVTTRGLVSFDEMTTKDEVLLAAAHDNLNADFLAPELLELAGWVISDGSVLPNENKVVIYQSATAYPEHCQTIESLIEKSGASWHQGSRPYGEDGVQNRYVLTGSMARELRWLLGHPKRLRPELVASLGREGAAALLRGLLGGDGHIMESGGWHYTTISRDLADAVLMLGLLMGDRVRLTSFRNTDGDQIWRVYRQTSGQSIQDFKRRAERVPAAVGGVWCPKTPNGTFVARRNGKVYITGNSWAYDEWKDLVEQAGATKTNSVTAALEVEGEPMSVGLVLVDMDDNPTLTSQNKAVALAGLSREEREMRKKGRFVALHGMIYNDFDRDVHVVPERPLPQNVNVVVGIDPGIRHACGVVWCYLTPDDTMVIFEEGYYQGMNVAQVCKQIHATNAAYEVDPIYYVIDPAARNKSHQSGRSDQMEYADHGIVTIAGQHDVRAGINRVKERLQNNRLYIGANCVHTINEFRHYRWRKPPMTEDEGREVPVKREDHLLDSLRYVCMSRPYLPEEVVPRNETNQQRIMREDFDAPKETTQMFAG